MIGRPDIGRLAVGAPADVVVLDDRLEIVRVLVGEATMSLARAEMAEQPAVLERLLREARRSPRPPPPSSAAARGSP